MTLAIFAEGPENTDPSKSSFVELWTRLASLAGVSEPFRVVPFCKGSIVSMGLQGLAGDRVQLSRDPDVFEAIERAPLKHSRYVPLDRVIEREFRHEPFERLIIAFDLAPKHNALKRKCRRAERLLLLTNLAASERLPVAFRDAAAELRDFYLSGRPARSRAHLEILLMDPVFEALVLSDEKGLRDALGLKTYPKEWPSFAPCKSPDEHIFKPACRLASPRVHALMRDSQCNDKHRWASYILANLPGDSAVRRHEIFRRLRDLLT